jgi:hypothetical protein
MADADQQDTPQQTAEGSSNGALNKVDQQLSEIARMLAEQNSQMQETLKAAVAASQTKSAPVAKPDPVYEPEAYERYLEEKASKIAATHVARERELNTVVYQLSQDYPEISSDASLKKSITEIQRTLPESIRETAVGYETAILKAVNKAGILPKSKRQAQLDEDVSMGGNRSTSSGSSRKAGKAKVSEETLQVAQLMGRDISDPKVLKGLEEAAQRNEWNKWR